MGSSNIGSNLYPLEMVATLEILDRSFGSFDGYSMRWQDYLSF
uniref:Uncharacterized protein n=1 Tax=Nelumbo nucifera TaxID=4432 RepID=A0A822YX07_NELNU|nr:TPA_asm: hypothetical protein HUJ06_007863 [Nelumbo nucifera]